MKRCFLILSFISCIQYGSFAQYKTNSVLATGDWYKLGIVKSGIYKIDYNFLKKAGINPDAIDPRSVRLFGNGGGMLPQNNSTSRIDDLIENAISIMGETDGKFDPSDYILFYGQGPDNWTYNTSNSTFSHLKNIYSDSAYYFITTSNTSGKRVQEALKVSGSPLSFSVFDDYQFYEKDAINILKSGREWYGEIFDAASSQNFQFNIPGLSSDNDIKLKVAVAVKPSLNASTPFNISLNGTKVGSIPIQGFPSCKNCLIGLNSDKTFIFTSSTENLSADISYDKSQDGSAVGYLNYIELLYKRKLQLYGSQTAFRVADSQMKDINYNIVNMKSSSLVWDVTTLGEASLVTDFNTSASANKIHELIVFTPEEINMVPDFIGKIANQNLHSFNDIDLVIVTHPTLLEESNRLADLRRQQGIKTAVVTVGQLYNEFSSGSQDITAIRDFCRMLYKRGSLKNLLLFGSCSYDYKYRVTGNTNLVPCYQSRESLHDIFSMSSEDYFSFFGDNQGDWYENESGAYDYKMDIGVGRLLAKNAGEASIIVDKLINYSSKSSLGKWRNRICFVGDDGDNNIHSGDADNLGRKIDSSNVKMNVNKIYIDAYPLVSTPAGSKAPAVNEAIRNNVNKGTLIMNYSGHGGVEVLAQENIITIESIKSWKDFNNLPFFVTATCDFSTYDNPEKVSGGANILITPKGGGIGLISATRPVYSNTNYDLNLAFYDIALKPDTSGEMPTLGDIIKYTKNNSVRGRYNRSYALLADPSMKLNYPKYELVVTKINTNDIASLSDTVKALSLVSIEGEVRDFTKTKILTDFDGILNSDIFDKYATLSTLGQTSDSPKFNFSLRNNVFYSGKSTVKNGKFNFSFIVPKDINYQVGKGKISLYAYDPEDNTDASGEFSNILVGGSDSGAKEDNIPPTISLFMDDTTFINGGLTGNTPTLLAKIYDQNGVNIARSGIGHEITSTLNNDENTFTELNDYYSTDLNNYKSGSVSYKLDALKAGNHTIKVKAWDTFNNSSEAMLDFIVAGNNNIAIQNLLNYPNPSTGNTTFQFNHNKAGEDIDVNIQIYDRSGGLVKEINTEILQSNSTVEIPWNIKYDDNYNITAGTYVYKCILRSKQDTSQTQAIQKLVLIY